MSKRLILMLALVFVVGFAFTAYAEVQNVKVGGEIFAFGISRYGFTLAKPVLGKEDAKGFGSIIRLRVDADLTDNVAVTTRLLSERVWGSIDEDANNTDIDLDLAYVTLKEFMLSQVTLVVGRQPIRLGNGLVLGDADTNRLADADTPLTAVGDLSARKAFDAILAVLDYSPLKIIAGFIKASEGGLASNSDDVDAYAAQVSYDLGTKNTVAGLTLVSKDAKKGEAHNIGASLSSTPMDNLNVSAEYVYQIQKGIRADRKMASDNTLQLMADYTFAKVAMKPSIGVDYTRLSGNWNVMFEDYTPADIVNAILPNSNMQIIGTNLSAKPMDDVTLKLRYANFRLVDEVSTLSGYATFTMDSGKKALGNEFDLAVLYDYTEDVQLGLKAGVFGPGAAFRKTVDGKKSASQAIGYMKVTF